MEGGWLRMAGEQLCSSCSAEMLAGTTPPSTNASAWLLGSAGSCKVVITRNEVPQLMGVLSERAALGGYLHRVLLDTLVAVPGDTRCVRFQLDHRHKHHMVLVTPDSARVDMLTPAPVCTWTMTMCIWYMSSAFATSFRLKLIWVWFQDRGSEFSLRRAQTSSRGQELLDEQDLVGAIGFESESGWMEASEQAKILGQ